MRDCSRRCLAVDSLKSGQIGAISPNLATPHRTENGHCSCCSCWHHCHGSLLRPAAYIHVNVSHLGHLARPLNLNVCFAGAWVCHSLAAVIPSNSVQHRPRWPLRPVACAVYFNDVNRLACRSYQSPLLSLSLSLSFSVSRFDYAHCGVRTPSHFGRSGRSRTKTKYYGFTGGKISVRFVENVLDSKKLYLPVV